MFISTKLVCKKMKSFLYCKHINLFKLFISNAQCKRRKKGKGYADRRE